MKIPFYQIDAFATQVFKGNPAAVCVLDSWLPDSVLIEMTREHNQSETAFIVRKNGAYEVGYFTVAGEIDLCGHATLASAHVLFNELNVEGSRLAFKTRQAGDVFVTRSGDWLTLDFPIWEPEPVPVPKAALEGLGVTKICEAYALRDYLFVVENAEAVRRIKPDYEKLAPLLKYICLTAKGEGDVDFVSRFFCPGDGRPEDPVTGSSHTMLIPYWSKRLNKTKMLARQLSERGGELKCELSGSRVLISGQAKTYLRGEILLDP